jgi:hypothetical protein
MPIDVASPTNTGGRQRFLTLGSPVSSSVRRKTGLMGRVLGADSYVAEIEEGVDAAFLSMVTD